MEKIDLGNGTFEYTGTILGFNYQIVKTDDTEFEEWLKAKLTRYRMNPLEKKIYQHVLGLDKLLARIKTLEAYHK